MTPDFVSSFLAWYRNHNTYILGSLLTYFITDSEHANAWEKIISRKIIWTVSQICSNLLQTYSNNLSHAGVSITLSINFAHWSSVIAVSKYLFKDNNEDKSNMNKAAPKKKDFFTVSESYSFSHSRKLIFHTFLQFIKKQKKSIFKLAKSFEKALSGPSTYFWMIQEIFRSLFFNCHEKWLWRPIRDS